jgi:4-aminobutyrate aminotransferase-like enzyme
VKEVLAVIQEEALIRRSATIGVKLINALDELKDSGLITAVRGRGMMIAFDISDEETCDHLYRELAEKGYIVGNRKTALRLDPPLNIKEEELDGFVECLKDILREYTEENE